MTGLVSRYKSQMFLNVVDLLRNLDWAWKSIQVTNVFECSWFAWGMVVLEYNIFGKYLNRNLPTETTLLGSHNDLILAMDRGEVTSLILLDLSAAFDTVDHSIILHRLQHWFGLHGTSLDWFSSYLTSRSQAVSIQNSTSSFSNLSCGIPQGSVFGPLLFTLYTTPLGSVISKNSIKYHLYADDTQLYISFTPSNSTS